MRTALLSVLIAATAAGCVTMSVSEESPMKDSAIETGFLNKTMQVGALARHYAVYVPREYDPAKAWPLIVFLHGVGERGDDGLKQTDVGIGRAIRFHADRFPCIVLMPQCPDDVWWSKAEDHIELAMADVQAAYHIDSRRIYLTGLSMGGFGTWGFAPSHIDTFAALMPVCGGGSKKDAATLAKAPIWAFHGGADETVPASKSREMVEAVKAVGGRIKYTEYPGVGHNSWDSAYGDPEAIEWLLKQRKKR